MNKIHGVTGKGMKVDCECLMCGHKQIGWTGVDGASCNVCGGMLRMNGYHKPPLGAKPRWLVDEERLEELQKVINEHIKGSAGILPEWVEEYNEIIARVNRRQMEREALCRGDEAWMLKEVCAAFGVPLHVFEQTNTTAASQYEQMKKMW